MQNKNAKNPSTNPIWRKVWIFPKMQSNQICDLSISLNLYLQNTIMLVSENYLTFVR